MIMIQNKKLGVNTKFRSRKLTIYHVKTEEIKSGVCALAPACTGLYVCIVEMNDMNAANPNPENQTSPNPAKTIF